MGEAHDLQPIAGGIGAPFQNLLRSHRLDVLRMTFVGGHREDQLKLARSDESREVVHVAVGVAYVTVALCQSLSCLSEAA